MECGKAWKKTLKNRSPGTLKIMVLPGRVAKKTTSTLLQKAQEMESKISSKSHKNLYNTVLGARTKKQQKKTQKNTRIVPKSIPQG